LNASELFGIDFIFCVDKHGINGFFVCESLSLNWGDYNRK